jgi:sterol 24-C-methyltransferase
MIRIALYASSSGFSSRGHILVEDLTENMTPMVRLFLVLAFVSYFFIRLLGLQAVFVNATSVVESWPLCSTNFKYLAITARKPV